MVEDFSQAFFSGYKSLKIFHNSWKFLIANSKMIKFRFWWCNFIKIELDNTSIKNHKVQVKNISIQIPKSVKWHTWKMQNRKVFQDAPKNSHKRTTNFILENVLRDTLIFSVHCRTIGDYSSAAHCVLWHSVCRTLVRVPYIIGAIYSEGPYK